jgi:hypothetical protein
LLIQKCGRGKEKLLPVATELPQIHLWCKLADFSVIFALKRTVSEKNGSEWLKKKRPIVTIGQQPNNPPSNQS